MPIGIYKRTKPPWNKNLTKETDPRVAKYAAAKKDTPLTAKNIAGLKMAWNRPGAKAERIKILTRVSKYPKVKARRSVAQKKRYEKSEERDKHRNAALQFWQKPDYIAKHSGENHYNWQGGPALGDYPFAFNKKLKRFIRNRDKICQLCGKTKEENGRNLDVHHVNHDYDDLFELNLIALCRSCNSIVNFNMGMWEDYLTFKLLHGIVIADPTFLKGLKNE